jgi:adenylate cyclase
VPKYQGKRELQIMTPSGSDEVRQRLSAILFADVVNYSGAMERDQLGTHRRVMRRVNLFKSLIGDYEGRVFDVEGDAVKAAFDSAFQAVRFAVDLQREFRNDAVWNSDPDEPVFRIGINLGEVIVETDGYYGHEVNVAARLQALASPGGICISDSVHRIVRGKLPITMSPIGRQSLKNMAELVEAYAIDLEAAASPTPPTLPTVQPAVQQTTYGGSIAVLPLKNLSGNPSDIHLCDGITSDIITNLSRFRDLLVIARHSAFLFRDARDDMRDVGQRLGVRYVLVGGLQRADNRLSLSVQLVDTSTEAVSWSDRYKGDLRDIFDFQDDITGIIAARVANQVAISERHRISSLPPSDLRAYGLVLRGQALTTHFRKDSNMLARHLFEEAAKLDPIYGRSYAGVSRTLNLSWRYRWSEQPESSLDMALKLARTAIEHDNIDARGHAELGCALLYQKEHEASLSAYDRAVDLNPNDADVLAEAGNAISASGEPDRAVKLFQRALRLNPYHPDWYLWYLGEAHFDMCNYEEAVRTLNSMVDKSEAHRLLAASYALIGQLGEAREHAAQVLLTHPEFSLEHWKTVPPDRNKATLERFIEGLRLAGLQ